MRFTPGAIIRSMSVRLGAAMALLAAVLLLTVTVTAEHRLRGADEHQAMSALAALSRSYAQELRTRLSAGELVVQTLTSADAGRDAANDV